MKHYCPPQGKKGEKLLFIRYSALGDVVRGIPLAATIKETLPNIPLTWLLVHPYQELVKDQPYVDDVLVWDRSRGLKGFIDVILRVRASGFTHLLSFQGTDRSAIIALFSGIKNRAGRHDWASFVYNLPREDISQMLGRPVKVDEHRLYYVISSKLVAFRDDLLKNAPLPRVACVIGASKEIKRWPLCHWADLINMIASSGGSAILLGHGREEEDMASAIRGSLLKEAKKNTFDLVGRLRLDEMAAIIDGCDAVIGGDTGPMHLALALKKPAIGLFGPTLPEQVGLSELDAKVIADRECVGCQNWDCDKDCLSGIHPENVFGSLLKLSVNDDARDAF